MLTLFRPNPVRQAAELAYSRIVEQARRPGFFTDGGVPDTLDGRFELICLHTFLYLHRLRGEEKTAGQLGRFLCETMFADFDRSLREMGTGDLSVGREVKRMAEAFYGRIAAYDGGLNGDDAVLTAALARNVYGTRPTSPERLAAMTAYMRREAAALRAQDTTALATGDPRFGPPPETPGE